MLPQRWAFTSELTTNELSASELAQIAAACGVQATRDLPAEWPEAQIVTVQAFPDPAAIPHGYSVATAMGLSEMPSGALGFHYTKHRQPAANIGYDPRDREGLATTFSHEMLEAGVDPSGNRLVICTVPNVGRRHVLVEVADPPEARTYLVDGLPMSDFATRAYYGPHRWAVKRKDEPEPITRPFSYTGVLTAPLTLARGGYLSYVDPETDEWGQLTWFDGPEPTTRTLGRRDDDDPRSHREWIDEQTARHSRPHLGEVR